MAKKEIMVVDDNLASLKQIGFYLSGLYHYTLRTSGEQAILYCQEDTPDLVLLDIEMPEIDGFETLFRLRQIPKMAGVPVIFISGDINAETELRALESGARDFISKPVHRSILLHRLALHLELSQYENDMETTRRELENNIVLSFVDLVDSKDSNTGAHVLRSTRYLDFIGKVMLSKNTHRGELTEESLALMVKASPFHDIGKIGISDVILLKPGPLTPDEYLEMQKHTTLGANFLRKIYTRLPDMEYLNIAAVMAETHHEFFDGSGYPGGLAGEDIPFCSRLLAAANVYDACLTSRLYRPALSHEEACRVIMRGRGTQFDPAVVDAFKAVTPILRALNEPQTSLASSAKRSFAGFQAQRQTRKTQGR